MIRLLIWVVGVVLGGGLAGWAAWWAHTKAAATNAGRAALDLGTAVKKQLEDVKLERARAHGIFICYRHAETATAAGKIHDGLQVAFPGVEVFRDADSLRGGERWREEIDARLAKCRSFVALVGPQWLTLKSAQGQRRLDDPDDFVHYEIKMALRAQNIQQVIPVLMEGTRMPSPDQLPEDIRTLADYEAVPLHSTTWERDLRKLAEALKHPKPRHLTFIEGAAPPAR